MVWSRVEYRKRRAILGILPWGIPAHMDGWGSKGPYIFEVLALTRGRQSETPGWEVSTTPNGNESLFYSFLFEQSYENVGERYKQTLRLSIEYF